MGHFLWATVNGTQVIKRKSPIRTLLALSVVIALTIGLYAFRFPLATSMLRDELEKIGLTVTNVEITAVSPWRASIQNLHLAHGTRAQLVEAQIEWSLPFSPKLSNLVVHGLALKWVATANSLKWVDLEPVVTRHFVEDRHASNKSTVTLPQIQIHDTTARVIAPNNVVLSEVSARSISLLPTSSLNSEAVEGSDQQPVEIKAELIIPSFRHQGWKATDITLNITGRLENHDRGVFYQPNVTAETWSFTLSAQALRHLAAIPAIQPVSLQGEGVWTADAFTLDTRFEQQNSGVEGKFHLHRDTETGEGQATFDIPSVNFHEGSFSVNDVSSVLAQYVAKIAGDINASGKIQFNDAWATPLQITGTGNNLVVEMQPALSALAEEAWVIDFGQSRFTVSLPPLSPEKGQAMVDVKDGGLHLGDSALNNLTGTLNFLSFSPLTCTQRHGTAVGTLSGENTALAKVVNCFYDTFAIDKQLWPGASHKLK